MPDIFDEIETEQPKGDVFDELDAAPKGDIFDEIAPAQQQPVALPPAAVQSVPSFEMPQRLQNTPEGVPPLIGRPADPKAGLKRFEGRFDTSDLLAAIYAMPDADRDDVLASIGTLKNYMPIIRGHHTGFVVAVGV